MKQFKQYIIEENQEFTSAKTSRNQLPATFSKVLWEPNTVNFDLGGGKYEKGTEFLKTKGVTNLVHDVYNRSEDHNNNVIQFLQKRKADTATVNNVLNVIKEQNIRLNVIKMSKQYLKPNGIAYFLIYEGNKSGKGMQTKDGWQNNKKTNEYINEVKQHYNKVSRKGNLIIAENSSKLIHILDDPNAPNPWPPREQNNEI